MRAGRWRADDNAAVCGSSTGRGHCAKGRIEGDLEILGTRQVDVADDAVDRVPADSGAAGPGAAAAWLETISADSRAGHGSREQPGRTRRCLPRWRRSRLLAW